MAELGKPQGIQRRISFLSKWYIIGITCAFLGLCVTLLQYVVSEALFGIDGMGGPYAERRYARAILERCDGNQSDAARLLGISRNKLARLLKA